MEVINYIVNHGTKDKPITNKEMASALNLKEVDIRKKINEARCNGFPICSCPNGYYYSEDKGEILKTIQSLMHRTIAVEKAVNGLLTFVRGGTEVYEDAQ